MPSVIFWTFSYCTHACEASVVFAGFRRAIEVLTFSTLTFSGRYYNLLVGESCSQAGVPGTDSASKLFQASSSGKRTRGTAKIGS